jgi:predicted transcriptional regulator
VEDAQVAAKQNLTVQLDRETIRKAKILAAKRGTSVSGFIASQIRESVQADDAYEAAHRAALELLEQGFHLGGGRLSRDELHER